MRTLLASLILLLFLLGTVSAFEGQAAPNTSGPPDEPRHDSSRGKREFEEFFHATLDFYGKLQRTPNGLYRDAYLIHESQRPNHLCSTAATGVGLMALCMDHELGRDPEARQKAVQTLRAINGKIMGFKIGREKAGYFRHFFSDQDGSGDSIPFARN